MPYKDLKAKRAYAELHYQQNKAEYMRRAAEGKRRAKADIHAFLTDYLRDHPCVDCGEDDPVVLEFDHRPGERKRFDIGNFRNGGYGLASVQTEVSKCDVRCANCHRRMTYIRANRNHRG